MKPKKVLRIVGSNIISERYKLLSQSVSNKIRYNEAIIVNPQCSEVRE